MKQMICKTSDVLPEGHVRVFPFLGRNVQVWRMADRVRAAHELCKVVMDSAPWGEQ